MFSLKSENIPFGLFLKGPKCCTLHMQVRQRGPAENGCQNRRSEQAGPQGGAGAERSGAVAAAALVLGEGHRSHQREETLAAPQHLVVWDWPLAVEGSPGGNQLGTSRADPAWALCLQRGQKAGFLSSSAGGGAGGGGG